MDRKKAPSAPRARYAVFFQTSFDAGPSLERFQTLAGLANWLRIVINVSCEAKERMAPFTGSIQTLQWFRGRWVAL